MNVFAFNTDLVTAPNRGGPGRRLVPLTTILRESVQTGLREVVRFVIIRARANAPIDTGKLRRSLQGEVAGQKVTVDSRQRARAVFFSANNRRIDARIFTTTPYAAFVHEFFAWPEQGNLSSAAEGTNPLEAAAALERAGGVRYRAVSGSIRARLYQLTPEGGVGGKYLARAVERNTAQINQIMRNAMRTALLEAVERQGNEGLARSALRRARSQGLEQFFSQERSTGSDLLLDAPLNAQFTLGSGDYELQSGLNTQTANGGFGGLTGEELFDDG